MDDVKDVSYNSGLLINIGLDLVIMGLVLLSTFVFVTNISFNFCKASLFLSSSKVFKGPKESCLSWIFFTISRDFSVECGKC